MSVLLDQRFGIVEVAYLTGQGRSLGDVYLEITHQTISNGAGVDVLDRDTTSPLNLRLRGFQTLTARITVPFTTSQRDAQNFSQLSFSPNQVLTEGENGGLSNAGDLPDNLPLILDARVRAFPGRNSIVQLFVSSATFGVDPIEGGYAFDSALFRDLNYSTTGTDPDGQGRVASRFSDFVRFPMANIPLSDRPDLRTDPLDETAVETNGAQYVYFSGDNVALSNAAGGQGSVFQEVGNVFTDFGVGKWSEGSSGGFLGTYDLREALPENEDSLGRIISVYGAFRDYNTVLSGGGNFEIIMFPNSGETYSFEGDANSGVRGRLGDIVAIVRNGNNQITNMYYGGVDLSEGTFELFPIRGLGADPADPDIAGARLVGTVNSLRDSSGGSTVNFARVRSFNYSFTSGDLPTGFATSGNVTVFRK